MRRVLVVVLVFAVGCGVGFLCQPPAKAPIVVPPPMPVPDVIEISHKDGRREVLQVIGVESGRIYLVKHASVESP